MIISKCNSQIYCHLQNRVPDSCLHLLSITRFTIRNADYVTSASSMQEATSEYTKMNLEYYLTNLKLQPTRSDERTLLIQKTAHHFLHAARAKGR